MISPPPPPPPLFISSAQYPLCPVMQYDASAAPSARAAMGVAAYGPPLGLYVFCHVLLALARIPSRGGYSLQEFRQSSPQFGAQSSPAQSSPAQSSPAQLGLQTGRLAGWRARPTALASPKRPPLCLVSLSMVGLSMCKFKLREAICQWLVPSTRRPRVYRPAVPLNNAPYCSYPARPTRTVRVPVLQAWPARVPRKSTQQ